MTVHGGLRYDTARRLLPPDATNILEIGAGVGAVGSLLARSYRYVGLEPDRTSFEAARTQVGSSGDVVCVREEDYETDERFDVVCAFEVLEHLHDEVEALRRWQRHLAPGGSLIVSVPAGRARFGVDARQVTSAATTGRISSMPSASWIGRRAGQTRMGFQSAMSSGPSATLARDERQ
jgi:2-polyprenyl-3-methyl-5-hydroxy-6-metoxy-1,4-benzoquinol methylase